LLNPIKFATYSAVPFVVVLTLNVAIIWRTVCVKPNLRRSFGVASHSLTADHGGHATQTGPPGLGQSTGWVGLRSVKSPSGDERFIDLQRMLTDYYYY